MSQGIERRQAYEQQQRQKRAELEAFERRLASRIADENDLRARRRLREMFGGYSTWTDRRKRNNSIALAVVLAVFLLLLYFAIVVIPQKAEADLRANPEESVALPLRLTDLLTTA